jgi:hypothetical protein
VKKIAAFNNVSIYIFLPRADKFARVYRQCKEQTNYFLAMYRK